MALKHPIAKLNNPHFLSLAANGGVAVFGMVGYALLCRTLSLPDRGAWLLFQTTFLLSDSLRSGLLATGFVRFYAGSDLRRSAAITGAAWYLAIVITGLLCIANLPLLLFTGHIGDAGLRYFVQWFGIGLIITLPQFMAACVLQAQSRFGLLLVLRLFNQLCFIGAVLVLYVTESSTTITTIYAYLLASAATSVLALFAGWAKLRTISCRTRKQVNELFHYGKYTVGTMLSANLFWTIDTYIVNFMLGPAALSVLNISVKLLELIEIPLRSFAASGMPLLAAAYNNQQPEQVIGTMNKITGTFTLLLLPVILLTIIFAEIPISLIAGGQYVHTEAVNLFRFFLLLSLLFPADRYMALTLDAIHRPQVNFIKALVMLVVTFTADYVFIHITGSIYGIAWAGFFPVITAITISYIMLQQYQRFHFIDIYRAGWAGIQQYFLVFLPKLKR